MQLAYQYQQYQQYTNTNTSSSTVPQFYDVSMYPYRKDSQRIFPYSLEQRVSFIVHSCVRKQKTLPALALPLDSKHCDNAMEMF
jgi:hypothetical protein